MNEIVVPLCYLLAAVAFIIGLKMMSTVKGARRGNAVGAVGMAIAILGTLLQRSDFDWTWIAIGAGVGSLLGGWLAYRVPMTAMPEFVAMFNGLGGLASTLVALCDLLHWSERTKDVDLTPASALGWTWVIALALSLAVGAVTFTGSMAAWLKLAGKVNKGEPVLLPGRHAINVVLGVAVVVAAVWLGGFAGSHGVQTGTAVQRR